MTRLKYTSELLNESMNKWGSRLISTKEHYNGSTLINYTCKCGKNAYKKFKFIVTYGSLCDICGKELSKGRRKTTFKEKYGVDCILQLDSIKDRIKNTNLEKYGTTCAIANKDIKEKAKQTWIQKYGVDNPNKCKDIINKTKNTCLKKYGVDNPNKLDSVIQKRRQTNLQKYGVKSYLQTQEVRKKVEETCLKRYGNKHLFKINRFTEKANQTRLTKYGNQYYVLTTEFMIKKENTMLKKYGVKHALQHPELFDKQQKSCFSRKKFIMPSEDIRYVQGFEPYALKELLLKYSEEEIKTNRKDIPTFKYVVGESCHTYYPDIYIPHENKIIEVKSEWLYNKHKETIILKGGACINAQYNYELWIYDKYGKRIQ